MQDQNPAFYQRKLIGKKDIEQCRKHDGSDHQQFCMPSFEDVAGVVENDETLNFRADEVAYGTDRGLLCALLSVGDRGRVGSTLTQPSAPSQPTM